MAAYTGRRLSAGPDLFKVRDRASSLHHTNSCNLIGHNRAITGHNIEATSSSGTTYYGYDDADHSS